MAWLGQLTIDRFLVFTLVLTRISGLVLIAPIFASGQIPMRVRAFLALALALLVMPIQSGASVPYLPNLVAYLVLVAGEMLVGLALGLGVLILFSGMQLAGQLIGQTGAMAIADVLNPGTDTEEPLLSVLFFYLALAVFMLIGGHRLVMAGLLNTFRAIPPGQGGLSNSMGDTLVVLLTQSFVLGIRAAAPALVAILLSTIVLGLVSRTLPQLNILAIGFGINAMVTLAAVLFSLGAIVWVFQAEIEPCLETVLESLETAA
jgi:flagellar biosynthesis protein FliR